jgi:8-oxo-dGTP pyrophosphatase MutT (NUDIX family)
VPPKVAINESIELAKTFGGENSGKFVNGVLGAVYKEIGEPGKEQTSKPKTPKPVVEEDLSKIPVEQKAGAIIYTKHDGAVYMAFCHDVFGYWTILKGGAEEGETPEAAAVREIKEKVGLDITIQEKLGDIEYIAFHPEKGKIRKLVTYFLANSEYKDLDLNSSGGLDKAAWFQLHEVVDLTMYDDILPLIAKAVETINK